MAAHAGHRHQAVSHGDGDDFLSVARLLAHEDTLGIRGEAALGFGLKVVKPPVCWAERTASALTSSTMTPGKNNRMPKIARAGPMGIGMMSFQSIPRLSPDSAVTELCKIF